MECYLCFAFYALACYAVYITLDWLIHRIWIGSLSDRYVLVTGCDTGFGYHVALRLDKFGVNVFAGCLTEAGETNLRKNASSKLKTVSLNVTKSESIAKAFDFVKAELPKDKGLWGLINNAGVLGKVGMTDWLPISEFRNVLDVNLFGMIETSTVFLPLLKKARGRIVNTASVAGRNGFYGSAPYCVSKFGVEGYSDTLRREVWPFGVSVHTIEPGFFKTDILAINPIETTLRGTWMAVSDEVKASYGKNYIDQYIATVVRGFLSETASNNIHLVVDAYINALLAWWPRIRYNVGWDAKLFWIPVSYLPDCISDAVFRRVADKNNAPKPKQSVR